MPELPEVEAARRLVASHCLGGKILNISVDNDTKVFDGISPSAFQATLMGRKIVGVHRKGKVMWLELDTPPWPSFQFGMSGAMIIKGIKGPSYKSFKISDTEEFPTSYSKVHFQLDNGVDVAFTDRRRFARIRLLADPSKVPPICDMGFDAYLELPSAQGLIEAFKPKKSSIKALLLDQNFVAGIGNWVADEVLYQSKIHPEQLTNSLKDEEVTRLHSAIREVLDKAVAVDADSEQFPRGWLFHHRWDKNPGLIDGHQIQQITIRGRTSAFVPAVQKYSGLELKGAKTTSGLNEIPLEDEAALEPGADADATTGDVSASKAGTSETPKRGRGRPPKAKAENPATTVATVSNDSPGSAKKRGRPPKKAPASTNEKTDVEETKKDSPSEPSKQRGPPRKAKADASKEAVSKALEETSAKEQQDDAEPVTPKRRGRPAKAKPQAPEESHVTKKAKEEEVAVPTEPKKRGRPPKAKSETDTAAAIAPTPKKRGRPART